jgi:CDP-glucose 4,6-dehydratase
VGERPGALEDLGMIEPPFWQGRRVLVTGHTGFKGSWLSLWLAQLGADVVGYALVPATTPNLFEAAGVAASLRQSVIGDIRDLHRLCEVIREARPEIVIHMAAQALVRASYHDPIETYSVNVLGTATLLEAVRRSTGVRAVVCVTSDKCYQNREQAQGYSETDPLGGVDPYASSKGCAELVTAAMRNSYFHSASWSQHQVAVASARAGNAIGGGDWAQDRLLPDLVRAFYQGNAAKIRRPDAIRPWQHVLEPLSGYLILAERLHAEGPAYAEGWNFGPTDVDGKDVAWVATLACELWGEGVRWNGDPDPHPPHEATYLKLNCSKAEARLGWSPRWLLERGLQEAIEAYRCFYRGEDLRTLCRHQIEAYMSDGASRSAAQL